MRIALQFFAFSDFFPPSLKTSAICCYPFKHFTLKINDHAVTPESHHFSVLDKLTTWYRTLYKNINNNRNEKLSVILLSLLRQSLKIYMINNNYKIDLLLTLKSFFFYNPLNSSH